MLVSFEEFIVKAHTVQVFLSDTWTGPVSDETKAREVTDVLWIVWGISGAYAVPQPLTYDEAFLLYGPPPNHGSISTSGQGYEHEFVPTRQTGGVQSDYEFLLTSTIGGVAYALFKFGFGHSSEDAMKEARMVDLIFTILTLGTASGMRGMNTGNQMETQSRGERLQVHEFALPTTATHTRTSGNTTSSVSRQPTGTSANTGRAQAPFSARLSPSALGGGHVRVEVAARAQSIPGNPRFQQLSTRTRDAMTRTKNNENFSNTANRLHRERPGRNQTVRRF